MKNRTHNGKDPITIGLAFGQFECYPFEQCTVFVCFHLKHSNRIDSFGLQDQNRGLQLLMIVLLMKSSLQKNKISLLSTTSARQEKLGKLDIFAII
jgi:hypothetical protein